jgi:hypothetical protein
MPKIPGSKLMPNIEPNSFADEGDVNVQFKAVHVMDSKVSKA